jgi:hypothetical protein
MAAAELKDGLRARLAPVFCQARSRLAAFAYLGALLAAPGERRSCWQLAEQAGQATSRRIQALLAGHAWDWKAALGGLQRFIVDHLADSQAVLVLDETAELKQGQMTVGVARQHAGIIGQVENCQTVVFAAYVTGRGHAPFDFRLYLPKAWCANAARRQRARVPNDVEFATKTEQGTQNGHRRDRRRRAVRFPGRRQSLRPQLEAARCVREEREGVRARGAGELQGHAPVPAEAGRGVPGPPGAGPAAGRRARAGRAARATATTNGPGRRRPHPATMC